MASGQRRSALTAGIADRIPYLRPHTKPRRPPTWLHATRLPPAFREAPDRLSARPTHRTHPCPHARSCERKRRRLSHSVLGVGRCHRASGASCHFTQSYSPHLRLCCQPQTCPSTPTFRASCRLSTSAALSLRRPSFASGPLRLGLPTTARRLWEVHTARVLVRQSRTYRILL